VPGRTGLFFSEQSADSLADAVRLYEACEHTFDPIEIASHAKSFSKARFKKAFREFVETAGAQRGDSIELTRSFERVHP
jgi:hypothetical protein